MQKPKHTVVHTEIRMHTHTPTACEKWADVIKERWYTDNGMTH